MSVGPRLGAEIWRAVFVLLALGAFLCPQNGWAQSLGNTGTVQGIVTDPSGAAVPGAKVTIRNQMTNYSQAATTNSSGAYRLGNLPPNPYRLEVEAPGFSKFTHEIVVRNSVPVETPVSLAVASAGTTIDVEATGLTQVEVDPSAHVDADREQLLKLPAGSPGAGLGPAIVMSTGAVSSESNGTFHPSGDHAQVSYVIDNENISDQQGKVFSTALPTSAIQSMELTTGAPEAEFGDKSSLVAQITTRSGLGATKPFGSVTTSYGSFGTVSGDVSLGFGTEKLGNFIAVDGTRSGRFLDSPEETPFHDVGNNGTIFDRFDFQPTPTDVLHLDLFVARNWIQIPNDYDQLGQDQRQRVLTWNIAPGYQHTFNSHVLLSVNPYIRKDEFNYFPSRDLFDDTPSTQEQHRKLMNYGVRSDLSINVGHHNIKVGIDLKQTRLFEEFAFGITDPAYNPPCLTTGGSAVTDPNIVNPDACPGFGFVTNPNLQPGLIPFDLTRGGSLFQYKATHNINQYAAYIQDSITMGPVLLTLGIRGDLYYGLVSDGAPSPRVGVAYNIKKTHTVLRVAYSRTFETPFNENLLLSSASGLSNGVAEGALGATSAVPISPGRRNQYNTGFQQGIGKYLLLDADYFWKFTDNAYDFSTLQNTTITFPIAWRKSKLDGLAGRMSTTNIHGWQTYWTFGHTRARFFPDQVGGLLNTTAPPEGVFRIDHDQAFQSTVVTRYQRKHDAEWIAFTWRYDSGEVVSGVPDAGTALDLDPNQQVTLGLACNGVYATVDSPLSTCVNTNGTAGLVTSKLITLPQGGYAGFPSLENDDHNPDRVKPRNVFSLGVGTDNLLHVEGSRRWIASLEVENLMNTEALYNFLSTFSGTHFLAPRTLTATIGYRF